MAEEGHQSVGVGSILCSVTNVAKEQPESNKPHHIRINAFGQTHFVSQLYSKFYPYTKTTSLKNGPLVIAHVCHPTISLATNLEIS
jgi:hypothetical protein